MRVTMLANDQLGAGVASVETLTGYRFIAGNQVTQPAMINLAGLDMSFEQATAILADLSDPRRADVIAFVSGRPEERINFINELQGLVDGNYNIYYLPVYVLRRVYLSDTPAERDK